MSNRKWNKGKPPHVGFWLTSFWFPKRYALQWRYWNGENWSFAIGYRMKKADKINHLCGMKTIFNEDSIDWCDYWPENARVPRINPDKEK